MKVLSAAIFLSLLVFNGCASKKHAGERLRVVEQNNMPPVNFSEQTTWLLGYINPRFFMLEPHSEWYLKEYDSYQPDKNAINELLKISKEDITIKIILGTWCPDSRREVPRFMRTIDFWQFSRENITFIGVDNAKESPVGEYYKLGIQRVPTFIIYKKNFEAGRIIEYPVTSLEQDMVNILTRNEN